MFTIHQNIFSKSFLNICKLIFFKFYSLATLPELPDIGQLILIFKGFHPHVYVYFKICIFRIIDIYITPSCDYVQYIKTDNLLIDTAPNLKVSYSLLVDMLL